MNCTAKWMWTAVVLGALVTTPALAADVFINGVKMTGQKDMDLGKVEVKLDSAGNVQITAPDIQIQELGGAKTGQVAGKPPVANPKPPVPVAPALTKGYFIITEGTSPGATGYDVKLMVNNKYVKTMADTIPQHVIELNEHLKLGDNTISFQALRSDRKAKGTSADAHFTIMIGVGSAAGGQLNIEEVVHEFKLLASDSGEKAKTFPLAAK